MRRNDRIHDQLTREDGPVTRVIFPIIRSFGRPYRRYSTPNIMITAILITGILLVGGCAPGGWLDTPDDGEPGLEARVLATEMLPDSTARSRLPATADLTERRQLVDDTLVVASARELMELSEALGIPVQGVVRSELRDSYTESRGGRSHEAIDILVPRGTPVLSAADGTLLRLFDSKPGGLMVYATDTSRRFILLYGHLDGYAPGMVEGMKVARGQVIGYVGTTGNAPEDTPHLHFGILRGHPDVSWSKGVAVNPFPLLVR
ncbi:M23 family metallopeptidase [soil metagenome]